MADVTQILNSIEQGDPSAAEQLLPLVYAELRRLAAAKMAAESPDHTLQATGLVHEAYLRLVDVDKAQHWNSRGHFFGAAAEAMRRILVEGVRRKLSQKRGADHERVDLGSRIEVEGVDASQILDVHDALDSLAEEAPQAADLVKLRFFAGLSIAEAADIVGLPRSTAYEHWAYARAWLRCAIGQADG